LARAGWVNISLLMTAPEGAGRAGKKQNDPHYWRDRMLQHCSYLESGLSKIENGV
jgi:hypothetical protein